MRGAETAGDDEFGDMETPEGTGEGQACPGAPGLFAEETGEGQAGGAPGLFAAEPGGAPGLFAAEPRLLLTNFVPA